MPFALSSTILRVYRATLQNVSWVRHFCISTTKIYTILVVIILLNCILANFNEQQQHIKEGRYVEKEVSFTLKSWTKRENLHNSMERACTLKDGCSGSMSEVINEMRWVSPKQKLTQRKWYYGLRNGYSKQEKKFIHKCTLIGNPDKH